MVHAPSARKSGRRPGQACGSSTARLARFVEHTGPVPKLTAAVAALLVALLGLARPAGAQPSAAPADPPPTTFGPPSQYQAPPPAPAPPPPPSPLSESAALGYSLAGTITSWALLVGGAAGDSVGAALLGTLGTFMAPSFGHWYRGQILTRGLGVRTVGFAVFAWGVVKAFDDLCEDCSGSSSDVETTTGLVIAGLLLYAGGTIDDIVTAPLAVRKHNQRLEILGIAPMVTSHGAGLALGGRF